MRELEFLPDWYPRLRRQRRRVVLQAWVALLVVAGLALWLTLARRNAGRAEAALNAFEVQVLQTEKERRQLEDQLRTKAQLDGGTFVVDGQKVWSSFAHIADWCLLLTRSDPESSRHAGLTYLIVDMRSPGVEVRPLRQITGESEFNEIFFTGVEVPVENVLGDVGGG